MGFDLGVRGDEGAGGDDAPVGDFYSIKDGTVHANEDMVADFGAVNDGGVADGDVVPYCGLSVDDNVVLDAGVLADDDGAFVTSDGGEWPDADAV